MPELNVQGLVKKFAEVGAVNDVSFNVESGKLLTLLGPSGCGKSTTLRCIAGLENPDRGEITLDGMPIFSAKSKVNTPTEQRNLGMVFQSYAIWPHMTVYDNIAYPLKVRKKRGSEIKDAVREALQLVNLEGFEERPAPLLSGGQQQRVALARALVYNPSLLLLDEPFSNLDARLREHMRVEVRDLQRRLKLTAVYVTHDQVEALAISDSIAIMSEGRILGYGMPHELFSDPPNGFVAQFLTHMNLFEGKLLSKMDGRGTVESIIGTLIAKVSPQLKTGEPVTLCVPQYGLILHKSRPSSGNLVEGKILSSTYCGDFLDYRIQVSDKTLRMRDEGAKTMGLSPGDAVYVEMPEETCMVVEHYVPKGRLEGV